MPGPGQRSPAGDSEPDVSTQNPTVLFADVSFAWPDGSDVLDRVTTAFGSGRTGLVGDNGAGKTTVLRLITGDLHPTAGTLTTRGEIGYLPQHLTLLTDGTVADLLGVRRRMDALRAIESGRVEPELFDLVGADWDIEARANATLARLGLAGLSLDRGVGRLSGGEAMLVALAGLRLANTPIVLLDEPTNNLDRQARSGLHEAVAEWDGALIVISHDTVLLDLMDDTAELRKGSLTTYGGGYTEFTDALAREQDAAHQGLRTADQALRKEQRQRREAETKLARRTRTARKDHANKRAPKVVMNTWKGRAQVSAGKLRSDLDARVEAARAGVAEQETRVRDDGRVRINLPDPDVPAGRRIAELHYPGGTQVIQGPERVALSGPNGIGKTLLLQTLLDPDLREQRAVHAIPLTERIGYLPQRIDGLDETASGLANVRTAAPDVTPGVVRANLARFRLRGDSVDRLVAHLSGGERFRIAMARLLLAEPANELLVLDEPTNNLDLSTVQAFIDALSDYRGALLVVSHDDAFLRRLGIDTWLTMENSDQHDVVVREPGARDSDRSDCC